jgi:hypothetical protein
LIRSTGKKVKPNWQIVRDIVISQLKGAAIKAALKKILGSAVMGGFKAWLVKFVVTELFEQVGEPLIRLSFRKGLFLVDKVSGKLLIIKLRNAKENSDENSYDDAIDKL